MVVWTDIVIPIASTLVGAVVTLVGVRWTIKSTNRTHNLDIARIDKEKREDERKRNTPFVKVVSNCDADGDVRAMVHDSKVTRRDFSVSIQDFYIKNISQNHIILNAITIDGEEYKFDERRLLEASHVVRVETVANDVVYFKDEIELMMLEVEDIYGNKYDIELACDSRCPLGDAPPNRYISTVRNASLPQLKEDE